MSSVFWPHLQHSITLTLLDGVEVYFVTGFGAGFVAGFATGAEVEDLATGGLLTAGVVATGLKLPIFAITLGSTL